MDWIHPQTFRRIVARHRGDYKVQSFSCWDQFLCQAFAQLTYRESLRDIEVCLRSRPGQLYRLGIRGAVSRSTLAHANEHRPWQMYAVLAGAFFVTRAKQGLKFARLYSRPVDFATGVRCDQTVRPTGATTRCDYPAKLRRIKFYDAPNHRTFVFLTNHFELPAATIAALYAQRWQIELFFRWIKQNLRIKTFYGTSDNAVRTQIWIAVCVYVLVAIVKKELHLEPSLYEILQILSVTPFEQIPLLELLTKAYHPTQNTYDCNQLPLW